ncbi:hypothetical protein [Pigmentiphaga sp.]|uniref:hypothetical protein n=1 Tax=Pigmentiphaga sp. TaxID=1977564 RepID=UPI00128E90D0|nr:hypothetical protein [Pigmentiphaga sp.]MPS30725.1 hypothetical protein [Alcaligenaceae bacterium SAGV5]MPS52847.1 hypothetical protein [Alcaligenaceae bacterium SAGV3]MPT57128.1 hypothetical protein [Alcaligenaceae bacterium]
MPVIKAFVSNPLLAGAPLDALGAATERACVDVLGAQAVQVQLLVVAAHAVPRGCPVYLEVRFRRNERRGAPVVARFMDAMESALDACFGALPRIRCFSEDQDFLHARN